MIFYSLFDLYNLKRNQWLSTKELEEIQNRKLKRLINHAYENVPYYHKLFDSVNVKVEDIKTVEDLYRIPITNKLTLQSLPITEITAKNVSLSKCVRKRTSGSQGIPLTIYYHKKDKNFLDMVWARARLENGQRLIDKRVSIRNPHYFPTKKRWYEHFSIWRRVNISCFDDVENQLKILEKVNPEVITSYPSSLKLLAMALEEQKNRKINSRLIFTSTELLNADARRFIQSKFEAPIFDFYGANELGLIAWECNKRSGYHINIDSVVVEFIWNGKKIKSGERGKLICTALHSYAMPFIRYEIGDVGIKSDEKCACERGLPLMRIIEGRIDDFIVLPDEKMVSPYSLIYIMRNIPGISRYQIIQEEKDKILVLIIKGKEFTQNTITSIRRNLEKALGKDVKIDIKIVNNITRDKSGKFRVVKSKVNK